MKITPTRLILFRIYNLTLGRFAFGDRLLRGLLLRVLVEKKRGARPYCQSADFFTPDQLG